MTKPIERELKLLVSKEEFHSLLKTLPFSEPWTQTNTYYDSAAQSIRKQGGALRIRTIGSKHILTLKIRKDEITHYEYEKEIPTDQLEKIQDPEILGWLKEYHIPSNLKKTAQFTTIRQVYECENAETGLRGEPHPAIPTPPRAAPARRAYSRRRASCVSAAGSRSCRAASRGGGSPARRCSCRRCSGCAPQDSP